MNPRSIDWLRYLVTIGARHDADGWRWKIDPALRFGGFGPWRPEWSLMRLPGLGVPLLAHPRARARADGLGHPARGRRAVAPPGARLVLEGVGHFVHIEHPAPGRRPRPRLPWHARPGVTPSCATTGSSSRCTSCAAGRAPVLHARARRALARRARPDRRVAGSGGGTRLHRPRPFDHPGGEAATLPRSSWPMPTTRSPHVGQATVLGRAPAPTSPSWSRAPPRASAARCCSTVPGWRAGPRRARRSSPRRGRAPEGARPNRSRSPSSARRAPSRLRLRLRAPGHPSVRKLEIVFTVVAGNRPPWLAAVVAEPGVIECPLPEALALFASGH